MASHRAFKVGGRHIRRSVATRIRSANLAQHPNPTHPALTPLRSCGDVAEVKQLLKRDRVRHRSKADNACGNRSSTRLRRLPLAAAVENSVAIAELLLDPRRETRIEMTDGLKSIHCSDSLIGHGERTPVQVPPHPRAESSCACSSSAVRTHSIRRRSTIIRLWYDSAELARAAL